MGLVIVLEHDSPKLSLESPSCGSKIDITEELKMKVLGLRIRDNENQTENQTSGSKIPRVEMSWKFCVTQLESF